jgi:hypothetical protein
MLKEKTILLSAHAQQLHNHEAELSITALLAADATIPNM